MKLPIVYKIWFCIGIMISGYLFIIGSDALISRSVDRTLHKVSDFWFPVSQNSNMAVETFKHQLKNYRDSFVFGDESLLNQAVMNEKEALKFLSEIEKYDLRWGGGHQDVKELIKAIREYTVQAQQNYRTPFREGWKEMDRLDPVVFQKLSEQGQQILKKLAELNELNVKGLKQEIDYILIRTAKERSIRFFMVLLVVSITVGLVFFIVQRAIRNPVEETYSKIMEITKGDLSVRFEKERGNEIHSLGMALNAMAERLENRAMIAQSIASGDLTPSIKIDSDKDRLGIVMKTMVYHLNRVIARLNEVATQVELGAIEISKSSQTLSDGAMRQTAALKNITRSMGRIGKQTKANADRATQASDLVNNTFAMAQDGSMKMEVLSRSMKLIDESGGKMMKIIQMIDGIAFQTNLLALNAAVEAARSGKHGKGFAVVAQEVRGLANRCASAAQETSELLEDSVTRMAECTKMTQNNNALLKDIEMGITELKSLVSDIAKDCREQAQSISDVNLGLEKIDDETMNNTSCAEETSAASETLTAQARKMRRIVDYFTYDDEKVTRYRIEPNPGLEMYHEEPDQQSG